ncbi:MAG: hypothetical protein JSU94_04630 [Phycisphaerales bacterium]|nr:MAG: hypothetical protein JSU94_04630 [Phycisphaerales bacterium]
MLESTAPIRRAAHIFIAACLVAAPVVHAAGARPFEKGRLPPAALIEKWAKMLQSPAADTRLTAVKDMWRARHETTAAMLLSMVADPDPKVSEQAMYMAEMNQKLDINTPAEPILELLKSDRPFHRAHAARLANSHHQPQKFADALAAAAADPDAACREWIFAFFKKTAPTEKTKKILIHAILNDPVRRNRAIAAGTLYHLGLPEAAPALTTAIETGSLSRPAFNALITCGNHSVVDFIIRKTGADSPDTRRSALNTAAWAKWFPKNQRDAVFLRAVEDPNLHVRQCAYDLIGRTAIEAANSALRRKLAERRDVEQESLFFALSTTADRTSGRALMAFVQKPAKIGSLALEGVAQSGNDSLIPELLNLLDSRDDAMWKRRLAIAICRILDKNPALAVEDTDSADRIKALLKQLQPSARCDRITLYRTNLAVVDLWFAQRAERWLIRQANGQWRVLARFITGVV